MIPVLLSSAAATPPVPGWLIIPFVLMLLAIAILPLIVGQWWEHNRNKLIVSLAIGLPTAAILIAMGFWHNLYHQMVFDYIPFIILLLGLFAVTGRIHIAGTINPTPATNTIILAIGAVLASIMGTTGAAMLLIRPLLAANRIRKNVVHTVLFFIAIVANTGGLLTPLGDPPLFLLYLRGADFTWFLHMAPEWALVNLLLITIYFTIDSSRYRREVAQNGNAPIVHEHRQPMRMEGNINFLWLAGVVASVAFLNQQYIPAMANPDAPLYIKFLREEAIVACILLSVFTTKKEVVAANRFTWHPITEVAILFFGIFITMTPALLFLQGHAADLGLQTPFQFYFATGALSGFLDNAPTALSFYAVALGLPQDLPVWQDTIVAGVPEMLLTAISMSAVFFGAMTYIGNGPNFMVKAIAEENGVRMPSFFRYITHFSLMILLPIFALIAVLFLL